MGKKLNWESDPVVLLEGEILPVLSLAPEFLTHLLLAADGAPGPEVVERHLCVFERAERHLRNGGKDFLGPTGMRLDGGDLRLCREAADSIVSVGRVLRTLARGLSDGNAVSGATAKRLAKEIAEEMRPKIYVALDVFRRVFIGTVLERQMAQAEQADAAIRQLSEISETIFFIAVNASVEAARAGEAGRGFAVIGQDIRSLSLSARAATKGLCTLMDGT